jgi:hypothetical protein
MPTRIISGWKEIPTTPSGAAVPVVPAPSADPWPVTFSTTTSVTSGSVSAIAVSTKTTIATKSFVLAAFENLVKVSVSGEGYAKFYLTLNTVDIDIRRTGPDRNLVFDFSGSPLSLTIGDVIDIKVEHFDTGSTLDFDATIYGY